MYIRIDPDAWTPEIAGSYSSRSTSTGSLKPGTLVAWERKPYRVVEVSERDQANWPAEYVEAWRKDQMPDPATWYNRPRVIVLRSEEDPTAKALHLQGSDSSRWWALPEHYPICRLCKEIPPCTHIHNERIMAAAAVKMDEDMSLMPGVCHGCREPVTRRQKSFAFPGANLIRPDLGDGSAIFHTRRSCYGSLDAYDKRWAKAEPGRERFFYCAGTLTEHHDGTSECSGAACAVTRGGEGMVQHQLWVRHHPRSQEARGCWCLAGVLF